MNRNVLKRNELSFESNGLSIHLIIPKFKLTNMHILTLLSSVYFFTYFSNIVIQHLHTIKLTHCPEIAYQLSMEGALL